MKIFAKNKKALFDYDILEEFQAGLELEGYEVKSILDGSINLKGAFVGFHEGEAFLTGAHISKYKQAGNMPDYDPERSRRLLLHKKEIVYLYQKSTEKGLTIIPLLVYTNDRLIKLKIAVGKGRKKYDKREVIKKRDLDKEVKRTLKEI